MLGSLRERAGDLRTASPCFWWWGTAELGSGQELRQMVGQPSNCSIDFFHHSEGKLCRDSREEDAEAPKAWFKVQTPIAANPF